MALRWLFAYAFSLRFNQPAVVESVRVRSWYAGAHGHGIEGASRTGAAPGTGRNGAGVPMDVGPARGRQDRRGRPARRRASPMRRAGRGDRYAGPAAATAAADAGGRGCL